MGSSLLWFILSALLIMNTQEQIDRVIKILENAVQENLLAGDNPDKGYPYAAGYSRSAMIGAIDDLKRIETQLDK